MDIKELKGFYLALEDIVTYNKNDYDENLFYNNLNSLKKCLVKYNVDIPNELKKSKTKHDLRHEFQKIGGYEKRRDRLKEIIYPLIDNMENNMNVETKVYSKEMDISKYLKENNFEINTRMGCIKLLKFLRTQLLKKRKDFFANLLMLLWKLIILKE